MDTITQTLIDRSKRQAQINHIVYLCQKQQERQQCIEQLGQPTTDNAHALITTAKIPEIERWLRKIEAIKGKPYAKVSAVQDAGIPQTLLRANATKAELEQWHDAITKTTFANGTKYQPLPSHDEAWQTFHKIRTELTAKRWAAEQWLHTHQHTQPMTDQQLIDAAEAGLWEEITLDGKRKLFKLMPEKRKQHIHRNGLTGTQAMEQTRQHYDKLYTHAR